MNEDSQEEAIPPPKEVPHEHLKRFTIEDLKNLLKRKPKEPLKKFTKEDLKKLSLENPPPTSAEGPKKVSMAAVLDPNRNASKLKQDFPRASEATPCKPPRDPQPFTRLAAIVLIVLSLIGYVMVKHYKQKPHVPAKNMPMRVIEGQHVYQPPLVYGADSNTQPRREGTK